MQTGRDFGRRDLPSRLKSELRPFCIVRRTKSHTRTFRLISDLGGSDGFIPSEMKTLSHKVHNVCMSR